MAKIHLLLLDDNTLFRVMLSRLLEADPTLQVVAECSSIAEALNALELKSVDMVLLDHDPENREKGLPFIRRARQNGYSGRILIMTAGMTASDCISALAESVCGIFFKQNPPPLLVEAIHKIVAGQIWIDPRCIQLLASAVSQLGREARPFSLTERETAVLKGVLSGLKNRQIGDQLSISEASVKSALQQLFVKTGVRTRTQLVRIALSEFETRFE